MKTYKKFSKLSYSHSFKIFAYQKTSRNPNFVVFYSDELSEFVAYQVGQNFCQHFYHEGYLNYRILEQGGVDFVDDQLLIIKMS